MNEHAPNVSEEPSVPTTMESANGTQMFGQMLRWLCGVVIVICIAASIGVSFARSRCLSSIKVTAIDPSIEPRDHKIPFFKQKEALPDYQIVIRNRNRWISSKLETKVDQSAVDGLNWQLAHPISFKDISLIQLRDKDKIISDPIAEVSVLGDSIEEAGYRFDFSFERSLSVGFTSFFDTQVGMAIMTGFCSVIVILISSVVRRGRLDRMQLNVNTDI